MPLDPITTGLIIAAGAPLASDVAKETAKAYVKAEEDRIDILSDLYDDTKKELKKVDNPLEKAVLGVGAVVQLAGLSGVLTGVSLVRAATVGPVRGLKKFLNLK